MRCQILCSACFALVLLAAAKESFAAPLQAYWKLDEALTANPAVEQTGNIPAGTYTAGVGLGVASPFPGFGTAASFDGNNWVNVGGAAQLGLGNDFSVSAWVNFDNFAGKHTVLGASGAWGVRSQGDAPHITTFGILDYVGNSGEFSAGTWHHFVTVLDASSDATFYVDGQFAGTVAGSAPANINPNPFAIGAVGPVNNETMQGDIDDVGVFDSSLTAAEVAAIYNLAVEPGLHYELGDANLLLEALDNGDTEVTIDGSTWVRTDGLGGVSGDVFALGNNQFAVNLLDGAGFTTQAVPEPASLALFSLAAIAALAYGLRRLRR